MVFSSTPGSRRSAGSAIPPWIRRGLPALSLLAGGCAFVYPQPAQEISVSTRDASGQLVTGAVCRLGSVRGTWTVVSPGSVRVPTSTADLTVSCAKPGLPDGFARLIPSVGELPDPRSLQSAGGLRYLSDPVLYPPARYADRVTVTLGDLVIVSR